MPVGSRRPRVLIVRTQRVRADSPTNKRRDVTPTTLETTTAVARPSLAEVRRAQELQFCNIAYEQIATWNEEDLLDFTVDVIKLPPRFSEFVGKALVEKDKTGNPCWQKARSPLKYVGKVAANLMKKEKGAESSPVPLALDAATRFVRNSPRDPDSGTSDQDKIDRLMYNNDSGEDSLRMDADLESRFTHRVFGRRDGTVGIVRETEYDWSLIGERLGIASEQAELLHARALGFTQETASEFLNWPEKDVARVWRSISRLMEDPKFARHAKDVLQEGLRSTELKGHGRAEDLFL